MLPRVLTLSSSRDNGGSQRHMVTLAAAYQAQGGSGFVACPPESFIEQTSREAGVQTVPFLLKNSGDLRAVVRLARLIRESQSDLLHSHARRDFVTATLAGRLTACPVVLHVHVVRPLGEPTALAGRFFSQVDAIVAVSEFARQELERWHPLRKGLVRRIYNGVETTQFTTADNLRPSWNIPENALVLGMVGRLTTKGQEAFLPVAARLAQQFANLYLVFVGPDGAELRFAELEQKLCGLGLKERSRIVGISNQIPAVMRSLDLLVHLPTDEAFGLAIVEASAAGKPVVASRVGGCVEVVTHQETGFLVDPKSHADQESAISSLLSDPALRQRMGAAGQRRVQSEFSTERQLADLCALYQELVR